MPKALNVGHQKILTSSENAVRVFPCINQGTEAGRRQSLHPSKKGEEKLAKIYLACAFKGGRLSVKESRSKRPTKKKEGHLFATSLSTTGAFIRQPAPHSLRAIRTTDHTEPSAAEHKKRKPSGCHSQRNLFEATNQQPAPQAAPSKLLPRVPAT